MKETIPVLDFTSASLIYTNEEYVKNNLKNLADEIIAAFSSVGFFYIRNHGITDQEIEDMHKYGSLFFNLPEEIKRKYLREENNHGWAPFEREKLSDDRPPDLKESYNITQIDHDGINWPEEVPQFKHIMTTIYKRLHSLARRMLRLIAIGLDIEDEEYFYPFHQFVGSDNFSTLRSLFYPNVIGKEIKPQQLRCAEHSDYCSVTLLFQDDIGGLEVMTRNKVYIPATPQPGCVLINIGELMQKWTGNKIIAAKHRVILPEDPASQAAERRSFAFFLHPDNIANVKSVFDEDDVPVNALKFVLDKFKSSYA